MRARAAATYRLMCAKFIILFVPGDSTAKGAVPSRRARRGPGAARHRRGRYPPAAPGIDPRKLPGRRRAAARWPAGPPARVRRERRLVCPTAGDAQPASDSGALRALVTGGAGFIGSHLADALLERGAQVAVLDSLATGRRENVAPGAEFFEADLRDRDAVLQAVGRFRPTHIFHQAAQASVKVSVDDPLLDAHVNVIGGLHLLEAAREAGVKRFVFASTGGALYGEVPDGR